MTERKLSELQKEYRRFFLEKLKLYGVTSPAELTREQKREFFIEIKQDWAKYKLSKKQASPIIEGLLNEETKCINHQKILQNKDRIQQVKNDKLLSLDSDFSYNKEGYEIQHATRVIKSEPNPNQTDNLRILYNPNNYFEQEGQYFYPVVKMPRPNAFLKLPRIGRSNQKGYKESDFFNQLKQNITDIELINNAHMVIPHHNNPYEPDIILFDKTINLYIDIEIDEPYDGYYRYPTHYINPENNDKQDDIRDLFFTESGWVVIRFTEKQVHLYAFECIKYIKNVLISLYNKDFVYDANCIKESQWDYNQCIQWQKTYYREKYLGIKKFQKQYSCKEIKIDVSENEIIENVIKRTKRINFNNWDSSIAFDEVSHKYFHPDDETGNAEYISVTTLIERFFPFDLKRHIEKKSKEENMSEEDALNEYMIMRDEAADKGTFLHEQIENFLKKKEFDSNFKEFKMFLDFYNEKIKSKGLIFFDAEKMIFSNEYNVAGTVDCLFRKNDKEEYVMLDWKRSKKLVIDGYPKKYGFGYALSELSNLDNSSYYKYCMQQNIYKYILETEYSIKISSMILVVLHENYSKYYFVKVPIMKRETNIILNSLKVKI